MKSSRAAFALSLVCVLWMGAAFAQADAVEEPMDPPQAGGALRDRDFGVVTHQFGLDRQVEMFQFQRRADGSGYSRVWNAAPIDSSRFAAGHENPAKMPLDSRRWLADEATLDGKAIDPAVLQTLGQWRVFRPNFSRLPANLAASFQPEGDGLGSAENPLEPRIGDVRIYWRELLLPPLQDKVELRNGRWQLAPGAAAQALSAERASTVVELPGDEDRTLFAWLLAGVVAVVGVGLVWRRVRRRRAVQ